MFYCICFLQLKGVSMSLFHSNEHDPANIIIYEKNKWKCKQIKMNSLPLLQVILSKNRMDNMIEQYRSSS